MKRLSILGSTGSIGTQTLDVCRNLGFEVVALAAGSNVELLEKQAREFKPKLVAVFDEKAAKGLSIALSDTDIIVLGGEKGVLKAAEADCDIVLNAVTGIAGLRPTIAAIEAGNDVALANKETLVAGGKRVMDFAKEKGVKIIPVDSEHSAIFQCLQAKGDYARIQKLILTASGGPFFGWKAEDLAKVTPAQALKHPNWSMGSKITIDAATLMNKALEVIEARWLFDVEPDNIHVLVHRKSIIHSLVEFADHSILAQLGCPDMRVAIQYALTWPDRAPCPAPALDLAEAGALEFARPDREAFPALDLGYRALKEGGGASVVLNGANELAVDAFLKGRIGFTRIPALVEMAMDRLSGRCVNAVEDVLALDRETRARVEEWI